MSNEPRNATETAIHDYKEGLGMFMQKMPDLAQHYNAFTEACFKDGQVSQKNKQLIALGISLYTQDEYCILYHVKGCLDNGASEEEIMEAMGVSMAFGGGAVMSQAVTLVQDALQELKEVH
ncbi:carboxymuconolactone decarboxylase family protein [Bacillus sp. CECT 9360]|uniref:carboxymuconolactone decarboxylase family protein n=1 Tax=Bacillus sp. CECT 9360 TaxID=2845821 RepID=UPI001E350479|nr:carboxymuconolactone decarboxylase family protein [Bacillus sp. CECT 9360]CAH0344678.1 hypothetical protein BCI9360_00938 [Bacillus sp. CECT 9360]